MKVRNILMLIVVVLILIIPVWIFFIAPELTKIPDDFQYKAPILSIDNFYDAEKQDFGGEFYSSTKFSYEAVEKQNGILIIKNIFDVRKFTGEKIFAVERSYGIDPKTGKHTHGYGDKDREGYLFAPRSLKKSQDFVYWHINYDAPANMKFKDEEEINDVTIYRYEAEYKVDQTQDLGHLPGVPEERGVNLDVNLQLWIEPVTGRMVKYEDNTIAYYYDINTKERMHPWNKFNNNFNQISFEEQIKIAKSEKFRLFILKNLIPALLGLMAIILLVIAYVKNEM